MNDDTPIAHDDTSPTAFERILGVCEGFEAAWRAGGSPRIEEHLGAVPEPDRPALLRELLALELELRRGRGERSEPGEYRARFPEDTAVVDAAFSEGPPSSDRTAGPPTIAEGLEVRTGPHEPPPLEPTRVHPDEGLISAGAGPHHGPGVTEAPAGGALADGRADGLAGGDRVRYFGDYEIRGELGRGGMGVVYRARQLSLNRPVALKMIRAGVLAGDAELRRFQNEAEAVALLDHPGIVPIYEVGEHDGQRYFSMKLIRGSSLADRLDDFKADPRSAARLVAEAAEAVHHAHLRGVLHRDLKPANILVDDRGRPHITDFGLARRLGGDSELTQSGAILGTPAYMSPEQASGRHGAVTIASDVYGLGAVLYAVLAGRAPFGGSSVEETLRRVRECAPEPPSRLNPRAPRDLEVICLKCLEKDPKRRYPSSEALAEDLRRWARDEPIRARRSGPVERAVKWARRRPTTAALIGLVGAGTWLGLGFGTALVQWRRAEAARAEAVGRARAEAGARGEAQRALAMAERFLYSGSLALAGREWSDAHPERVRELLDRCPPALRRWEWSYLDALGRSESLAIHEAADVVALAYDPAGSRLATATVDRVTLRDAATGRSLRTLAGHPGGVRHLAFSPDGNRLAAGDREGTVRIWSPDSAAAPQVLGGHGGAVLSVAFRPDGRQLAVAVGDALDPDKPGWIKVREVETGAAVRTLKGHRGAVTSVAYSPDGRRLASGSEDGTIRLWDVDRGEPLRALTRDPRTLAADNRLLQVFGEGRLEPTVKPHTIGVQAVAFSPDGRRLASACSDMTATLWDPDRGTEVRTFRGHLGPVKVLAFRPDGRALATAGDDRIVRLWSVETGRELASWRGHRDKVLAVAYSPDGHQLATADGSPTARVWDATRPQEYVPLGGPSDSVFGVAFSGDGRLVAGSSGDLFNPRKAGAVTVWDVASRRAVATLTGHAGGVSRVAFGPDSRRLATAGADGTVRVWDLGQPQPTLTLRGHTGPVLAVAFRPDGRMIASGSGSLLVPGAPGELKLWDAATGRLVRDLRGPRGAVGSLAFRPDGRQLTSGGGDRVVRVWDPDAGREVIGPLEVGQEVFGLAYSPDGRWLAAAAGDTYRPTRPGAVRIWESAGGRGSTTLRGHTQQVTGVAFSPDGTRLVSSGRDGLVLVWDPHAAEVVSSLRGSSYLCCVVFSPDGRRIAAGSWDARVLLWEASAERDGPD